MVTMGESPEEQHSFGIVALLAIFVAVVAPISWVAERLGVANQNWNGLITGILTLAALDYGHILYQRLRWLIAVRHGPRIRLVK